MLILIRLICSERSRGEDLWVRFPSESKKFRDYTGLVSYVTPNLFFWSLEPFCLKIISNNAGEAVFVKYVVSMEVVGSYLWVSWAMANEMSHCLCLVVTSGAISCQARSHSSLGGGGGGQGGHDPPNEIDSGLCSRPLCARALCHEA